MNTNMIRAVLGGLCAITLVLAATPFARAQSSNAIDRTMTDFNRSLSVAGFDASLGQLVGVDLVLSADIDSRVLEITNNSGTAADFTVINSVQFCADIGPAPASHAACAASTATTALRFETQILAETFTNLAAGATASSGQSTTASDSRSIRVLDVAGLAHFTSTAPVELGVATQAGFQALGGGGNSLVEIETFASVRAQVDYIYAGVAIDKLTNGADGISLMPGDPVSWTYDVTNTGNTALQNAVVTDDREGPICTIAFIDAGATEQCTATGTAGSADYTNLASVAAEPVINPSIEVTDDDPSSYVIPTPTPTVVPPTATPVPPAVTPTPTVPVATPTPSTPTGGSAPLIDIELATNGIDADEAPGVGLAIGDAIVWSYVVTNTGPVDLFDVVVSDDLVGGVCRAVTIPVGAQTSCRIDGVAEAGDFRRVGDVIGESAIGQRVADVDPTHHTASDEVLGVVVTPTPVPDGSSATPPALPDEVLAYTGQSTSGRGAAGAALVGVGFACLGLSSLRRRTE